MNTSQYAVDENRLKEWLIGTKENPGKLGQLGISVEQFARDIGRSRAALYYFIKDTNRPSPETLAAICTRLGVSLEEGLKWVDPRAACRPTEKTKKPASRARKQQNKPTNPYSLQYSHWTKTPTNLQPDDKKSFWH